MLSKLFDILGAILLLLVVLWFLIVGFRVVM